MDFMILDLLCYDALPKAIDVSSKYWGPSSDDTLATAETQKSIKGPSLVVFGRQASGESVCARINGYKPWTRFMFKGPTTSVTTQGLIQFLTNYIMSSVSYLKRNEIVVTSEMLPQFYGFVGSKSGQPVQWPCFKVYLPTFAMVSKLEFAAKRSTPLNWYLTDSMSTPVLKATNELGLCMSNWITLSKFDTALSNRISTCNVELETCVEFVRPLDKVTIAPIKILSFDAEMYSHDNGFPSVLHGDHTIAICCTLKVYGQSHLKRTAFVLWTSKEPLRCSTPDLQIHYFNSTLDLLEGFRDYIVEEDPDIFTGWNIYGFDMPFLWDEYNSLHLQSKLRGSEALRKQLVQLVKPSSQFLTCKELLQLAKTKNKHVQLTTLTQRQKLSLDSAENLEEHVAGPLRSNLRNVLCMPPEDSFGGPEDLKTIKLHVAACPTERVSQLFQQVMCKERHSGIQRFQYIGRFVGERSILEEKRMSSSAKGDNCYNFWSGRTCLDLMQIIKDDKKLDDNTLKFTAQTYLDPEYGKIDMSPAEIFSAYRTLNATQMALMLDYCARDADIPILLIEKLSYVPIWIEMSRVSYTSLHSVLNGGQQRKVYNLISHFVHNSHALNVSNSEWPDTAVDLLHDDATTSGASAAKKSKSDYQGATVIEPIVGFYTEPISTLDFESLYPSIMIHFNLCPSVYVATSRLKDTLESMDPCNESNLEIHTIDHIDQSSGALFQKQYGFVKHIEGVVPRLLQHLLKARKIAKKAMALSTDSFEQNVQNGRQLALKISCNSVYGFFGVSAHKALMSCKPVAAVTTLKGRAFIEASKTFVETTYPGSKVVYGDTDSVMILWKTLDNNSVSIPKSYALAEEASAAITDLLRAGLVHGATKPLLDTAQSAVTLANEKVYCPYLLIQKKNYAGLKYTIKAKHRPDTLQDFDSCVDMKGIDAVRRDRSKLVKTLSENVLDALLVQKSLDLAISKVQSILDSVVNNEAPIEWFVLSKSLKSIYKTENQPHVQARKRMIARSDQDVPEIGTRMPYVIVRAKKSGVPLYEHTEHPDYVKKAKLRICAKYYLENAQDVIARLLGPTGQGQAIAKMFSKAIHDADHKASGNTTLFQFFKKVKPN